MDKEYHLKLNGKQIPVTKEVYYAFKRPVWREHKRRKIRSEIELSYEAFTDDGFDIPSEEVLVDEIVEHTGALSDLRTRQAIHNAEYVWSCVG